MSGLYLPSTLSSMETPWEMLPSVGMRDAPPDPATTEPERVPATDPLMDEDMRRGVCVDETGEGTGEAKAACWNWIERRRNSGRCNCDSPKRTSTSEPTVLRTWRGRPATPALHCDACTAAQACHSRRERRVRRKEKRRFHRAVMHVSQKHKVTESKEKALMMT